MKKTYENISEETIVEGTTRKLVSLISTVKEGNTIVDYTFGIRNKAVKEDGTEIFLKEGITVSTESFPALYAVVVAAKEYFLEENILTDDDFNS